VPKVTQQVNGKSRIQTIGFSRLSISVIVEAFNLGRVM
jgi:hypothetical protein